MHTIMSASSSVEAGQGHPQRPGTGVRRASVARLKAIGYVLLLFAVVPAEVCIATGRAGVPALFSTACGVVSCVAATGKLRG